MPKIKIKTHSGAKKRFNLTKNGKVKRGKAFRSHIAVESAKGCLIESVKLAGGEL